MKIFVLPEFIQNMTKQKKVHYENLHKESNCRSRTVTFYKSSGTYFHRNASKSSYFRYLLLI